MNFSPLIPTVETQTRLAIEPITLPSLRTASNPRTWTVDEVVARLCRSNDLFKESGIAASRIPDQHSLEQEIRRKNITGEALLTNVHLSSVSSKLSLYDEGEQQSMVTVVNQLWRHSKLCEDQGAPLSVGAMSLQDRTFQNPSTAPQSVDNNGCKRQKLTHVTDVPMSTAQASATLARPVHNPFTLEQLQATSAQWNHLLRWENQEGGDEEISFNGSDSDEEMDKNSSEGPHDDESEAEESEAEESEAGECEAGEINADDMRPGAVEQVLTSTALRLKSENIYPDFRKLNADEISHLINRYIDEYTTTWEGDPEKRKQDPIKLWTEAQSTNNRLDFVRKHRRDVDFHHEQLDLFCDEIVKETNVQLQSVLGQCRLLEGALDNILRGEWLLSIYQLDPEDSDAESSSGSSQKSTHSQTRIQRPQVASRSSFGVETPSSHMGAQAEKVSDVPSTTHGRALHPMLAMSEAVPPATQPVEPSRTRSQTKGKAAIRPSQISWVAKQQANGKPPILGDQPHTASIQAVRKWKWTHLMQNRDRKRVVSKAVLGMEENDREAIRADLQCSKDHMFQLLARSIQGLLAPHDPTISAFTKLFLCWWTCGNCFEKMPLKEQLVELQECMRDGNRDPRIFIDYVNTILHTTFSQDALKHPHRPSQAEVIEISDDEEEIPLPVSRVKSEAEGKRSKKPKTDEEQQEQKAGSSVVSPRIRTGPKADDVVIVID